MIQLFSRADRCNLQSMVKRGLAFFFSVNLNVRDGQIAVNSEHMGPGVDREHGIFNVRQIIENFVHPRVFTNDIRGSKVMK